jgi:WD40 repeat protein
LAGGGGDSTVYLWETRTGQLKRKFNNQRGFVNWVVFSPNGKTLIAGGDDNPSVRLWEVATGKLLRILKHEYQVYSGDLSPDGRLLACGSLQELKVWDARKGKLLNSKKNSFGEIIRVAWPWKRSLNLRITITACPI